MLLLLVKLIATPVLLGGASLVARRWGPGPAGWLVALPLTSGPLVVYVALEHGLQLGLDVGLAVLSGGFGLCAYAVVYARASRRWGAFQSGGLATLAFLASGIAVEIADLASLAPVAIGVGIAILGAILLVPETHLVPKASRRPRWDLPARMAVGTALVVALSTFAPVLGPRISGLAATYPVYVSTLAVFAHRQDGPAAATALLRGLVLGMYGWVGYFVVLLLAMPSLGVLGAFGLATLTALAIQGASLRFLGVDLMRRVPEVVPGEALS